VWQGLYDELKDRSFVVLAVALDSGGVASAGQWILAAKPTYPCLIDERHIVAELYSMVNVPSAVWIDEAGRIVRPTEVAGASDAFRTQMDRKTKQVSAEGIADRQRTRTAYLNALRDWTAKGAEAPSLSQETKSAGGRRVRAMNMCSPQLTSVWENTFTPRDTGKPRCPTSQRRGGSIRRVGATGDKRGSSRSPARQVVRTSGPPWTPWGIDPTTRP